MNGDGAVNGADFAAFADCLTGALAFSEAVATLIWTWTRIWRI